MGLVGIVTMKTLVLCVDRDNDIGAKTGLQAPLIGRDQNLAAATKLGLADPEDSDVNALLSAVSIYDGLQKDNTDAEVATICGDVRVGAVSDLVLTKQLDQVLEQLRPDRVFLVSDGAEDEAFSPIIGGIFFGADTAGRNGGTSYVSQFLWFVIGAVWWIVIGTLLFEGGKVISAYLRHGRAPRHAVAVAVTFVALGLLVLGMTQILQTILGEYNPAASLPLIYLSMGLALFLVAVTGLSYRTREQGPQSPDES